MLVQGACFSRLRQTDRACFYSNWNNIVTSEEYWCEPVSRFLREEKISDTWVINDYLVWDCEFTFFKASVYVTRWGKLCRNYYVIAWRKKQFSEITLQWIKQQKIKRSPEPAVMDAKIHWNDKIKYFGGILVGGVGAQFPVLELKFSSSPNICSFILPPYDSTFPACLYC